MRGNVFLPSSVAVLCLYGGLSPARAQVNVSIVNSSFEQPVVNYAPYYTNNGGVVEPTPGWSGPGGVIYIAAGAGTWGFNTPAPDGSQIGYLNGVGAEGLGYNPANSAFAQQLTATVQPGTYTLSTDFGNRLDGSTDLYGMLELYAGGSVNSDGTVPGAQLLGSLAVDPTSTPKGTFKDFSFNVNVPAGSAAIGENLIVRIQSGGFLPVQTGTPNDQIDFDNVRLTYAPVPEASTLLGFGGMLATGGLALLRRRRAS